MTAPGIWQHRSSTARWDAELKSPSRTLKATAGRAQRLAGWPWKKMGRLLVDKKMGQGRWGWGQGIFFLSRDLSVPVCSPWGGLHTAAPRL